MRILSTILAFVAAVMLTAASASAAEKRVVPANKTTGVTFIYYSTGQDYNCQSSGRGKYKVNREPKHGSVHLEWRKLKSDFQGGCKNATMSGLAVYYTPNKGYHGDDDFSVHLSVPGLMPGNGFASGRSWSFKIEVQ